MIKLVILGAGQQGRVCKRLALENGMEVHAFVDDYLIGEVEGIKVYKKIDDIDNYKDYHYFVAIGKIPPRNKFIKEIERLGLETVNLIDKDACIEDGAIIGSGNYIHKLAVIYSSAIIGNNNIINCKAVCATDSRVGNNNNISMGCNICGGAIIGDNNYIGCQASIVSGIHIGSNSVVGAGAVVLNHVGDNVFVAGVPARPKERKL